MSKAFCYITESTWNKTLVNSGWKRSKKCNKGKLRWTFLSFRGTLIQFIITHEKEDHINFLFCHSIKTTNRSSQQLHVLWLRYNVLVPMTSPVLRPQQADIKVAGYNKTFTLVTHSSMLFYAFISWIELVSVSNKPENPECSSVIAFFYSVW